MRGHISLAVLLGMAWLCSAREARAQATTDDLRRMSLQELLDIEVATVSRQPESATLVPAAVYVITQEDIRRSGATSIPEALRLAPGIQVARIDGGRWSIGMRGFADRLARSMLVLMDGRALYSPLFAGTYWEVQDTLMDNIDRIEVVRGPGGTLWGANAVNGVINIITKSSRDTQGMMAKLDAGNGRGLGAFQFGGTARGGAMTYRFFGKGAARENEFHTNGLDFDQTRVAEGGFRGDWTMARGRRFTLQGDAYTIRLGSRGTLTQYESPFTTTFERRSPLSGGNVLARLTGSMGTNATFQLQTYYDHTSRNELPVSEDRDTIDIDFQQTQRRWNTHQLTWGLGYRVTTGRITATPPTSFRTERRTDDLLSGFVQDDIVIVPERWRASVGTKLEHNAYSGFEIQPSGRLVWTPSSAHTVVSSITRAVRVPSRVETDYTTTSLVNAAPTFVRLLPNPEFVPEKLVAYEASYRVRPAAPVYVTFSGFFNHLQDSLSTEILTPFVEVGSSPRVVIPVQFANGLHGSSHGAELTADVRPTNWWRWTTNYSYLRISMTRDEGSRDSNERRYEGFSPRHQVQLQSSFDLPHRWSADWMLRHVSRLPFPAIPAYTTSDVRLAWQMTPRLELAVVGQNLHQASHVEWPSGTGTNIGIERRGHVRLIWRR